MMRGVGQKSNFSINKFVMFVSRRECRNESLQNEYGILTYLSVFSVISCFVITYRRQQLLNLVV